MELCDVDHLGLDDNCNGIVDEGCPCNGGQAHSCFKGDPSYLNAPGCYPGTEQCNEFGTWGPCMGGVHATDNCFAADMSACHAITSVPFADVHLKDGTGSFSANASGETWTVECPMGVSPCPGVTAPDVFKPLQSGEYTVTYTKSSPDAGMTSCKYPLFVGARGLRIELQWEHGVQGPADQGVDLDLHLHQPMDTGPWSMSGETQECLWENCTIDSFSMGGANLPDPWFPAGNMPPDPVNWYLDPVMAKNSCYFAPRGMGMQWQSLGKGCHNPRLDLDNINCDPTIVDVNDPQFCAPENINVDFPPTSQWMRIGVHYYNSYEKTYDVHPVVKIFCNGELTAQLGDQGFYKPSKPITFSPSDGVAVEMNRFWMVADVIFTPKDKCSQKQCVIEPVYADPINKTPFYTLDSAAEMKFGPPYPPMPLPQGP
jgi:hypothetical protein